MTAGQFTSPVANVDELTALGRRTIDLEVLDVELDDGLAQRLDPGLGRAYFTWLPMSK